MRTRILPAAAFGSCLLIGIGAASADQGAAQGRYLSDPAFLPVEGQFSGSTAFTMGDGHANTYDSTGALFSHVYDQTDRVSQTLAYGITDDISLDLGIAYFPFDKRSRSFTAGGSVERHSTGFTNPNFGITWRALDENSSEPVNLDLFGSYSPDWVSAQASTAVSGGSEGRGGQVGQLGLAVSHVTPMFTVYGSTSVLFDGARDVFNPATGTDVHRDSSTDWHLGLDSQFRFPDNFSMNAGIGETVGSGRTTVTGATGVEHLDDPGNATDLHLAVNYAFDPDSLVGSLTYAHTFNATSHTVFPATPAADSTTRGRQDNVWGVRLDYAVN